MVTSFGVVPETVRVLSIDGGGIRGIIPALVLTELERRSGRRAAELFDVMAGASTGGILALALSQSAPDGRPAWPAERLVDLYESEGPRIFSRDLLVRIRSVEGILDEKYSAEGLDRALRSYMGDARLPDALTDVLVTAYETEERSPFIFTREHDVPIRLAARATAAAPTYFEPLQLELEGRRLSLIDGGVYATNPAMLAFADVRRSRPDAEVILLSLGTGQLTRPLPFSRIKDWGLIEWARPIIDVVFDGVADTIDLQLDSLMAPSRYWRLQTALTDASDDLDDVSPDNLRALRRHGETLVRERSRDLDAALEALGGR